jgi:hypothetical protein
MDDVFAYAPGNPCGAREPWANGLSQQRRVTHHMTECQQVVVRVSGCLGTLSTASVILGVE